jgi:hypothetical protein
MHLKLQNFLATQSIYATQIERAFDPLLSFHSCQILYNTVKEKENNA